MFESIIFYIWKSLASTLIQILVLLVPGLLLTIILYFETGFLQRRTLNIIGRGWYLWLFGWLGTIVHELGHAIFCIIFLHKITDMKLFHPDPQTGTLGYIKHSYKTNNIYQFAGNFFIGIGPILLGTVVIYLITYCLLDFNPLNLLNNSNISAVQVNSWNVILQMLQNIWNSSIDLIHQIISWHFLSKWQFYVFVYLAFAIGSLMTLSPPDIKGALGGFLMILVLIFIFNLATVWIENFTSNILIGVAGLSTLFYAVIVLVILLQLAIMLLLILPFSLITRK
jgi:hypothetical protein